MFGNVTALEGLHVTGKYRTKHDAHTLQACGLGSSHLRLEGGEAAISALSDSLSVSCARNRIAPYHSHPGGNPGANFKSTSHRCYLQEVAFEWELTEETINFPVGCLRGGRPGA